MSMRIIGLILLFLATFLSVIVYMVFVSFSEYREYSSGSFVSYLLMPAELSFLSEQCMDKPNFVYRSADGPKPTVTTMSCTIARRDFENQMDASGFQYMDGLYKKNDMQIQVVTSLSGEEVTSVTVIGVD